MNLMKQFGQVKDRVNKCESEGHQAKLYQITTTRLDLKVVRKPCCRPCPAVLELELEIETIEPSPSAKFVSICLPLLSSLNQLLVPFSLTKCSTWVGTVQLIKPSPYWYMYSSSADQISRLIRLHNYSTQFIYISNVIGFN